MRSYLTLPDGAQLAYSLRGEGPALVLISGLGGTAKFWESIQNHLISKFRVLIFDQRGMGYSTAGNRTSTLNQLAEDAYQVINTLLPGTPLTLIGHSTGGVIAQCLSAKKNIGLEQLILSGSWVEPDAYMHHLFHLRQRLLDACPELYHPLSSLMSYKPELENEDFWVKQSQGSATPSPSQQGIISERIQALLSYSGFNIANQIAVPTLVLGSQDDIIIPFYHQQKLAKSIPNATLHSFENGGHFFPITRKEEYLDKVSTWLSTLAPPPITY